jgi:hypothetical protein
MIIYSVIMLVTGYTGSTSSPESCSFVEFPGLAYLVTAGEIWLGEAAN